MSVDVELGVNALAEGIGVGRPGMSMGSATVKYSRGGKTQCGKEGERGGVGREATKTLRDEKERGMVQEKMTSSTVTRSRKKTKSSQNKPKRRVSTSNTHLRPSSTSSRLTGAAPGARPMEYPPPRPPYSIHRPVHSPLPALRPALSPKRLCHPNPTPTSNPALSPSFASPQPEELPARVEVSLESEDSPWTSGRSARTKGGSRCPAEG